MTNLSFDLLKSKDKIPYNLYPVGYLNNAVQIIRFTDLSETKSFSK